MIKKILILLFITIPLNSIAGEKTTTYNQELFKKAQSAVDDGSYSEILDIAKELEIPPPKPTVEDVNILEKEAARVSKQIKKIKETYAWTWYHANDKDSVMERYIVKITKMCSGS